ncbi:hypothetical protein GC163_06010 [bacterium]|nr:hypothetical protein [bacterium]
MSTPVLFLVWAASQWGADPGLATVTRSSAAPTPGMRHYLVQVRIIEVDDQGRQKVLAQPVLQTPGAAAGVTVSEETGRRFEFHFSATEPGAPAPLPVVIQDDPKSTPAVQATDAASLHRKVSVKAVQQPHKDVLQYVARQAGFTVVMEPETAAAAAPKLAQPITVEIDQAPLDEVLQELMKPLDLGYSVRQDLVLIGAQQAPVANEAQPVPVNNPPKSENDWQVRVYGVADLVSFDQQTGKPDFEPLIQRIQRHILPKSWQTAGSEGTVKGFDSTRSLVIRQSSVGHDAIANYLEQLRRSRDANAPQPLQP